MAEEPDGGHRDGELGVVPGSGLAGIFRAFLPRGNLVFNLMHAAAVPSETEERRPLPLPMVAMGGRGNVLPDDQTQERGPIFPISQEITNYRSNVAYHGRYGQNNIDNRGVSRGNKRNEPNTKGEAKKRDEAAESEAKTTGRFRGAKPKAHGRSNTTANERRSLALEEIKKVEEEEEVVEKKRADMNRALDLAKAPNEMKKAKVNFKRRFLAFNTMQAKNSKRRKVMEIMTNLTDNEEPFPVDQELLIGVGTALDEAQLQSGDQYIHEVKLMQLEAGFDWGAPLERQLFLIKNALKRHKGPEVRASECKPEHLEESVWKKRVTVGVSHARPAQSYAFTCIWMLRAAEAAKTKVGHVKIDDERRSVSLLIPSSKTDQRGKGVKRTLVCRCQPENCTRWCAWYVAKLCLAGRGEEQADQHLFKPAKGNRNPGKAQMVKAWAKYVNPYISGHSARRSGAMHYTREGMDVADIMFLGRWKSSAVFRYVEEAMEEMPANRKLLEEKAKVDPFVKELLEIKPVGSLLGNNDKSGEKHSGDEAPLGEQNKSIKSSGEQNVETLELPRENPEDQGLWAISCNPRGKVAHVVVTAAWGLNLESWSTACGWHFAERNVKVKLARNCPDNTKKCSKCVQSNMVRDKVIGGHSLAQSMAATLEL